ncbi:hypothetical protein TREES_T100021073 [Tupaia chinensis]|uniref:Uncharacterized protein n=1 Tax=Tupaia chinensis TaxID=246437 RepID=L9JAT0_TUPCH|nr:hypothetical protein TREES_T100021073 [Tupaia chinensis]
MLKGRLENGTESPFPGSTGKVLVKDLIAPRAHFEEGFCICVKKPYHRLWIFHQASEDLEKPFPVAQCLRYCHAC